MMTDSLFIGLMSGTSMDAVDCALVRCQDHGVDLLATHQHSIAPQTRQRIATISQPGPNEIEVMGALDRELGVLFAEAALKLLAKSGIEADRISAIGSHGQTIRHRPPSGSAGGEYSFTLQIGDPNTIAEHTGIVTVADFRRRDIAAGGEGAPLAPVFHAAAFAKDGVNRAIVNIGGIANVTLLEGLTLRTGFDTGPGNTLLDHWIQRHRGQAFDRDGQWSSSGDVVPGLLQDLLQHSYFALDGPRSTGKEVFNLAWLDDCLCHYDELECRDVQATLAEFTARSIVGSLQGGMVPVDEIYICGGGAHNTDLIRRLRLSLSPADVASTAAIGMDPDWVEAAAFAWLAGRTLDGLAGNAPAVTGATGQRVLGGIFAGN